MGFALWLDDKNRLAWAQGTQEYRPMGAAVIAIRGQFRHRDFQGARRCPPHLSSSFAGFFGSLEEVNRYLQTRPSVKHRSAPPYVR